MKTIRTFIAIAIPGDVRAKIAELQFTLKNAGGHVSWPKPENIHLTLKFLGDTDENLINEISNQLNQSVKSISQFKIAIKGVGAFPNLKYPRVIWIGAESEGDQIRHLVSDIEDRIADLGFKKESRPFSAHLTLGRVKEVKGIEPIIERLQQTDNFEAGSFPVEEVRLIKSELHPTGAIYTTLKKFEIK